VIIVSEYGRVGDLYKYQGMDQDLRIFTMIQVSMSMPLRMIRENQLLRQPMPCLGLVRGKGDRHLLRFEGDRHLLRFEIDLDLPS
jgi:hypothetical protein